MKYFNDILLGTVKGLTGKSEIAVAIFLDLLTAARQYKTSLKGKRKKTAAAILQ